MGIGDINTGYADSIARNALDADQTGKLRRNYAGSSDEELMSACKQFEEYFVEQVFKEAQKTIIKNDSGLSSADRTMRSYYEDSLAKEISSAAAEQQDLGLARMMFEQMKRTETAVPPAADPEAEEAEASSL